MITSEGRQGVHFLLEAFGQTLQLYELELMHIDDGGLSR